MTVNQALILMRYQQTPPTDPSMPRKIGLYYSKQRRLVDLVGNGGTLWVASTRRRSGQPPLYSLSYKFINCRPTGNNSGRVFSVRSSSVDTRAYPNNDMKFVLLSLRFDPYKPIESQSKIGQSLQTPRRLRDSDAALLEEYSSPLLSRRSVFISYSRKDTKYAEQIQEALDLDGIAVWRDVQSIMGGEDWEEAIERAIGAADFFILLQSNAAAASKEVQREVNIALDRLNQPNGLRAIIPIRLPNAPGGKFSNLCQFQELEWGQPDTKSFLDRLIRDLRGRM